MTIIADSIAKHLSGSDGVKLQIFRGYTIAEVASTINSGADDLYLYGFVIIHVGTNDIGYRASFHSIISDYGNLIGIIREKKPTIQIILL